MGNFDRGDRRPSGGRPSFGQGRSFGGGRPSFGGGRPSFGGRDRDSGPREMHTATCSECGNSCQIPFKPNGSRPVFCSDCFSKQEGGGGERRPSFGSERRERRERPAYGADRQMHEATCAKCSAKCQVPFLPTPGKPVFCENCFEKAGSKDTSEIMEQLKNLNFKIDKLVKILTPGIVDEKPAKSEAKKEVKEVVEVETTKEKKAKKEVAPKKVAAKSKKK